MSNATPDPRARHLSTACSRCGVDQGTREDLTAKAVAFRTVTRPRRVLQERTTDWLCNTCLLADPDYKDNQEPRASSPAFKRASSENECVPPPRL